MVQRALKVTDKTRDSHEVAMNNVADALKRLFVQWRLIDQRTARSPWCVDYALEALAERRLSGHRVLIFEATVEVWTSYCNVQGPRECLIGEFAKLADAAAELTTTRSDNSTAAYLWNISRWGSVLGLHREPKTERSLDLDKRLDSFLARLEAMRAEAVGLADALAARRQPGLAMALYGPKGAGPRAHFAYALHLASFSNRQIALIRGDVPSRRKGADLRNWRDALEKAAKNVYLEIYRIEEKLAETKTN